MSISQARPRFWPLQLLGWGGYFIAMAFSRIGRFPLAYMLAEKSLLTVLGIGISLVLRTVLRHTMQTERSMTTSVVGCVLSSYMLAALWTAAANVMTVPIEGIFLVRTSQYNTIGALFDGTVYNSFTLVAWGFLYLGLKHYAALQDERERVLHTEKLLSESRLRALQYQLNPHLFFNTLNAISTLVAEHRNSDATLMIARLGDFLRSTLRDDISPLVPLADELTFATQYLDIEQVRFGDRLNVTMDIDEDAYRVMVPSLVLQPLLENAARHGVARCEGPSTISISANLAPEALVLTVENSAAPSANSESGIGLRNVRERLSVLFGDRAAVQATMPDDVTFRVTVALPRT